MIADTIWDMILGKAGKLPGPVAPELIKMAKDEGRQFLDTNPQDNYPDDLDEYRKKMAEKGWPLGEDDEELFEYAMHPTQYEAYKSGKAKADFEADLAKRKAAKNAPAADALPTSITVNVGGTNYKVDIAYDGKLPASTTSDATAAPSAPAGEGTPLLAPLEGKFFRVKDSGETPKQVGDAVKEGDVVGYIEAMKTYNAIKADRDGVITAILVNAGDTVEEDDEIMKIG